ncbi:hypothetical protein CPB85DRAFT_944278 [Mucidula mucida]|nr:hypothetical protein CPB85DRAFT_944278 [Mucidula mucida]
MMKYSLSRRPVLSDSQSEKRSFGSSVPTTPTSCTTFSARSSFSGSSKSSPAGWQSPPRPSTPADTQEAATSDENDKHPACLCRLESTVRMIKDCHAGAMIPTTSHSSFLITLSTPDIVWIDKSFAIPALLYLDYPNKKLPIVRRPSGFGKTSIISMFDHFLSVHKDSRSDSSTLFTATCIADVFSTDSPRSMLAKADFQNHLFLEIDLDGLEVTSEEVFKTSLLNRIARCMMWFMRRYRWLLDADGSKRFSPVIRDNEGHLSIAGTIIELVANTNWKVFVCIDNYDYPQRASKKNLDILKWLQYYVVSPLGSLMTLGFVTHGIILGIQETKITYNPYIPDIWEPVTEDLSDYPDFATAFGLTISEIRQLGTVFSRPGFEKEVSSRLKSQCFPADSGKPVYCTRDVIQLLSGHLPERVTPSSGILDIW